MPLYMDDGSSWFGGTDIFGRSHGFSSLRAAGRFFQAYNAFNKYYPYYAYAKYRYGEYKRTKKYMDKFNEDYKSSIKKNSKNRYMPYPDYNKKYAE